MLLSETAELLAFINSFEGRETTEIEARAWHRVIGDVDPAAAADAVREHYETTSRRIWPADIRRATVDSVGRDEYLLRA